MSTQQAGIDLTPQPSSRIQWGWIIAGAFILELALVVVFVPFLMSMDISKIVPFVPIGTFAVGFLVGWWTARKVQGRWILHGTLIGAVATVIYVGLCMAQPGGIGPVVTMYGPFLFVIANGLRIVGSALGAYVYRSRSV